MERKFVETKHAWVDFDFHFVDATTTTASVVKPLNEDEIKQLLFLDAAEHKRFDFPLKDTTDREGVEKLFANHNDYNIYSVERALKSLPVEYRSVRA